MARARRPLAEYARKRDFSLTPEPGARKGKRRRALSYCIQQHAASRLHWDFRLELDGVLLSWAVPKGPSLDPADRRLAVQVEDHPVEYGGFEGVIPEGEYGGGTVLLWDRGTWDPPEQARADLERGRLKFTLHGEKLRGGYNLVRLSSDRSRTGRDWLLIKERDAQARAGESVVATEVRSVKSGRTIVEVARAARATERQMAAAARSPGLEKLRTSKRRPATRGARAASGRRKTAARPRRKARRRARAPALKATPPPARRGRVTLPAFVAPELCTLVALAPEGTSWVHEVKLDGYRLLAAVAGDRVRLWSRNHLEWTDRLPELASALRTLPSRSALLDGELVVADARGRTSFEKLKAALGEKREDQLSYVAFDLLHLDGRDLRGQPLLARKEALARVLRGVPADGPVRHGTHVVGRGPLAFTRACRAGLEGVVSKRADAPYRSGRGGDWLKVKCIRRQEFVLLGFTEPTHREDALGSLLLGVHDKGRLRYAGRVGTGFDAAQRRDLRRRLQRLAVTRPPVAEVPREPGLRDATWARPRLVAEVAFTEWTRDGRLRHPSYQGLREDKRAQDVVVERPRAVRKRRRAPALRRATAASAGGESTVVAGVRLTHPDKLLWPEDGVRKADLVDYLRRVAPRMLPHLRDRPLTLVRCPGGSGRGCFFQKHATGSEPDAIGVIDMPEKAGTAPYMTVRDAAGLVAMAQIGALELHIGGVRADAPRKPDRMVLDLDPAPDVPFARVMEAARELRKRLAAQGLTSFVMTTGGKGLHVVVPLRRGPDIEQVSAFAEGLARQLEQEDPRHFIAKASKASRTGRIFIDWIRNARGATAICPYSPRARPGAPVAVPLAWSELRAGLRGDRFGMAEVIKRLARRGADPWAGYARVQGRLPRG